MIQTFEVIQDFEGAAPISGQIHRFRVGEILLIDAAVMGDLVPIEVDSRFFVADRPLFEASCKRVNNGANPFF